MAQIGATPLSLKSPEGWRGLTTLSKSAANQFLEMENCYVSSDGNEIRTFPGYVCVLDPASTLRSWSLNQPFGYIANHFAARRGGLTLSAPTNAYKIELAPTQQQYAWTRPTHLHGCELLNGRWTLFGQSDFVREPILNVGLTGFVKVISYTDLGATTLLTCDANPLNAANTFNAVVVNDKITLSGLTGAGAAALNDKGHVVTAVAGATITINTDAGATVAGQNGYVDRVTHNGNTAGGGTTPISDDQESLTIWTMLGSGNPEFGPNQTAFPAHVFNRQRDFGDAIIGAGTGNQKQGNSNAGTVNGGRSRRRQKTLPYRLVPHIAGTRLILVAPGYGCVFQVPCKIPPNFDETSLGLGVHSLCNDIYDQPRCLGVPKAVMWSDPDKTVAPSGNTAHIDYALGSEVFAFGGSNAGATGGGRPLVNTRNGTYKFKVAYKDEVTGELGLTSEELVITTDNVTVAFEGILLYVYFPGYLMHECGALSINLYRTVKDGDTYYFDQSLIAKTLSPTAGPFLGVATGDTWKYGAHPASGSTEFAHHVVLEPKYTTDAQLQENDVLVPEAIEQMPMGHKCARTIRGFTLFGGALGNAGSRRELQRGTLTMFYDRNLNGLNAIERFRNHIGSAFTNDFDTTTPPLAPASFEGVEEGFGCAARNIPPAYSGQIVSGKWFPYPRRWIQLDRLVNTTVGYDGTFPNDLGSRIQDVRYTILDTPLQEFEDLRDGNTQLQTAHLLLPRAQLQISEPDNPGVTPATNTTVIASDFDDDVEAIGDANGQAVVCTRSATYMIAFSSTPISTPPDLAHSGFGCIAANSMVSFDGGCAWISERGPAAWIGGVQFIGESLERHFSGETARYLRDSTGMMRHAWGCHDPERKLIYFGLYAGRAGVSGGSALTVQYKGVTYDWTAATSVIEGGVPIGDQIKSLFPADEVLVYSYQTGVWSVWRPPLSMGIQWMTRGVAHDGSARTFFLGSDKRVYQLGDEYGQGDRESFRSIATDTGTLSVLSLTPPATGMSWVGLTVAIYSENATTGEAVFKGLSTITVATPGVPGVTLASPITVTAGDIIIVGARTMRLHTSFFNVKNEATTRGSKAVVRHHLWSRFGEGVGGSRQQAFVAASLQTEQSHDSVPTRVISSLTTDDGGTGYRWLNQDLPDASAHAIGFNMGAVSGPSHQLQITLVGGAQVRLHDLAVEVQ